MSPYGLRAFRTHPIRLPMVIANSTSLLGRSMTTAKPPPLAQMFTYDLSESLCPVDGQGWVVHFSPRLSCDQ
jgi:hypothetical protein